MLRVDRVMKAEPPWAGQSPYEGGLEEPVTTPAPTATPLPPPPPPRGCSSRRHHLEAESEPLHTLTQLRLPPGLLSLQNCKQYISSFHKAVILYCVLVSHMSQDMRQSFEYLAFYSDVV